VRTRRRAARSGALEHRQLKGPVWSLSPAAAKNRAAPVLVFRESDAVTRSCAITAPTMSCEVWWTPGRLPAGPGVLQRSAGPRRSALKLYNRRQSPYARPYRKPHRVRLPHKVQLPSGGKHPSAISTERLVSIGHQLPREPAAVTSDHRHQPPIWRPRSRSPGSCASGDIRGLIVSTS